MPFRHNHIKLDDSYDINASLITSPLEGHAHDFISTQVPKKKHLSAYWKMIWAFNVSLVIMVCSIETGEKGYISVNNKQSDINFSELFGNNDAKRDIVEVKLKHFHSISDSHTSRII